MKCIRPITGGNISRVKDEEADEKVGRGEYNYCSKEEWKEQGANNPLSKSVMKRLKAQKGGDKDTSE